LHFTPHALHIFLMLAIFCIYDRHHKAKNGSSSGVRSPMGV
jgi:hypothetical protein